MNTFPSARDKPDHVEFFASLLASDRLASRHCTVEQLHAFAELLESNGGSMTGDAFQDLLLIAVYYSRTCGSYGACQWLDFETVPGWEDDVVAQIRDEEFWIQARERGESGNEILCSLIALENSSH